MAEELPLFLLNTVLFPHMLLPLRVFEPRYRQMVDLCMERDRTFGVLFIKSGVEVGGPAEPYDVGTTAHIKEIRQQPDGALGLSAVGVQRFQLLEMVQTAPFPLGLVEYLQDNKEPGPRSEILAEVAQVALRCLQLTLALNNEWVRQIVFPSEADSLSYLVAARLPIALRVKQLLLEIPNATARLQRELPLLTAEEARLSQMLLERAWLLSALLN